MAKELLKREEIPVKDTWNTRDMYETIADWEKDLTFIKSVIDEIEAFEGKATASAKALLTVADKDALVSEKLSLAHNYASRLFDQDQGNTTHQAMVAKVSSLYADYAARTAFVNPEILALDPETLETYYKEEPALELYRKSINEFYRMNPHSLSAVLV